MKSPIPIIRIFDETLAKKFYIDFLGFKVDWEHRFAPDMPIYFQISQGECLIHLSEHAGDCQPGAALRIETLHLSAYHTELQNKKMGFITPAIVEKPWGFQELSLTDPFGNRMIFCKELSTKETN